ncbi:MAG: hypothetical protein NT034_00915 [Candidatus Magasanikbacteria bacterium]|nr:hypothetical protein [Candidatus Magasanikbacteria bacterium]
MRIERPNRSNWPEKKWPRVAFIAHALLDGYLSTDLIGQRLDIMGKNWPRDGETPEAINWFSFPVIPTDGMGQPVWVDFYIIPVLAGDFMAACGDGRAYKWAEEVALTAIMEAKKDKVHLTLGWGALTKVATRHGEKFLQENPWVKTDPFVSTTHGDAGTAALVLETIRRAGLHKGFHVAVIGANGAIGDVVARALPRLNPESILLVGKPGESSATRLHELRARVEGNCEVKIHQNKSTACHENRSDLVIVATTGMDLVPSEIPSGALVLDMTTPSACSEHPDWKSDRLVLTSGCGQFDDLALPESFGQFSGNILKDVGAGGHHVLWGCTMETIARAVFGWRGHLAGQKIPLDAVEWCDNYFQYLRIAPQPPVSFGDHHSWSAVHAFVERVHAKTSVETLQYVYAGNTEPS